MCITAFSDPTPQPVDAPLGHGPISWPALTADELNFLWIHRDDVEARINYRQKEAAFWREYMVYVVDRDLYATGKRRNFTTFALRW